MHLYLYVNIPFWITNVIKVRHKSKILNHIVNEISTETTIEWNYVTKTNVTQKEDNNIPRIIEDVAK